MLSFCMFVHISLVLANMVAKGLWPGLWIALHDLKVVGLNPPSSPCRKTWAKGKFLPTWAGIAFSYGPSRRTTPIKLHV